MFLPIISFASLYRVKTRTCNEMLSCNLAKALVPLDFGLSSFWHLSLRSVSQQQNVRGDPERRLKPLSHSPALSHATVCSLLTHTEISIYTDISHVLTLPLTFLLSLRVFSVGLRWMKRTVTLWAMWRPENLFNTVLVTCFSYLDLSHLLTSLVQVMD